jgi:hypothetical protein
MMSGKRLFWLSSLAPLLVGLAAIGICGLLYWQGAKSIAQDQLDRETRRVEFFSRLFSVELQSIVTDIQLLSDGDGLHAFLATGSPPDRDRAIHRAVFFGNQRPNYDQLRFIDKTGQEVIRVNANAEIVPPERLQNKSDRPYFQKTMALTPGQIYISAFDLNEENGHVEEPLKRCFEWRLL